MTIPKLKAMNSGPRAGGNTRRNVAECLKHFLAETYLLQIKTQYYHWNVTGAHFHELHLLFESQYNELAPAVDEIAERIRALGGKSPGTLRQFAELSSLREDKELPRDWREMVANLTAAHETLARNSQKWLETAQEAGDEGTADLFIRRIQAHDKAAWMLRSHLE